MVSCITNLEDALPTMYIVDQEVIPDGRIMEMPV